MQTGSRTMAVAEVKMDGMMCGQNVMFAAAAAGAAIAYFGLDRTISVLPPEVHWGLGGLLVSTYCQTGTRMPSVAQLTSTSSLTSMAYGVGGGFALGFISS
jgi:hypothetical protein